MKKFQIIVTVQRQITLSRYIKGGNFEGENHELDTGNDVTFKKKSVNTFNKVKQAKKTLNLF